MKKSELKQLIKEVLDEAVFDDETELAYRIPGKGGWKRKKFKNEKDAVRWVDKLIEKEGDDVEVVWRGD